MGKEAKSHLTKLTFQLRAFLKALDRQRIQTDSSKVATTWQFQRFIQMLRSAKKRDVLQLLRRAPEETR